MPIIDHYMLLEGTLDTGQYAKDLILWQDTLIDLITWLTVMIET